MYSLCMQLGVCGGMLVYESLFTHVAVGGVARTGPVVAPSHRCLLQEVLAVLAQVAGARIPGMVEAAGAASV